MITDNLTNTNLEDECFDENEDTIDIDESDNEFDNELTVSVNASGELIARSTQIADYQLRNEKLQNISVWDFISSLEKSLKSRYKDKKSKTSSEQMETGYRDEQVHDPSHDSNIHISDKQNDDEDDSLQFSTTYANSPLNLSQVESKRQKKELFSFLPQHSESNTHCLTFREKVKITYLSRLDLQFHEETKKKFMRDIAD
jgi:hypothetical protein